MNDEKTPYSFQQELKEKGLNKRQFARMVGRHEKTVQAWGNDIPNWARVVLDTFDPADLNKRLIYCESVIESFRKDIQRLQEVSEEFRKHMKDQPKEETYVERVACEKEDMQRLLDEDDIPF